MAKKLTKKQKKILSKTARIVGVIAILVLLGFWIQKIELQPFVEAIEKAKIEPFIYAMLAVAVFWMIRAHMLWVILKLKKKLSWWFVIGVSNFGGLLDLFIPARGGYVVRWAILSSRMKEYKSFTVSALAALFMLEGAVLVLIFLLLFALDAEAQSFSSPAIVGGLVTTVGIIVVCLIFAPTIERRIRKTFLKKIIPLVALFGIAREARQPLRLLSWVGAVTVQWMAQILVFYYAGLAFGLELTLSQMLILLISVNLAILIPIMPGSFGTIELAVSWVMVSFGFESGLSLAFALVYHLAEVIPVLLLGGLSAAMLPRRGVKKAISGTNS